ncbi:hypothetical protein SDJN02_06955, partial [Cucurbita argyrosperma subsp. argyrosperma]
MKEALTRRFSLIPEDQILLFALTVGHDSATEHLKLTITLLHGKHGPHAWEQSGRLDPVGYNSIPSTSLAFSCTGTHDKETE